jgi:pre-mRNA-processing factor 40
MFLMLLLMLHFQFRPVVPSQQPPQFMPPAAQQFRPVGQPMPGANIGMPGQMPHFPQPGQHLPHSNQVPPASQGVPMVYQSARPMSSAPMQPQQQSAYPGGHLPSMGAPMQPPTYTVSPISHSLRVNYFRMMSVTSLRLIY